MKKYVYGLLAAGLAILILLGCGRGANTGTGQSPDSIKVGFVVKSLSNQYWPLLYAGAAQQANELGVELMFTAPNTESDVARQVENIESLVAAGVDVLCVAPAQDEAVLPALENALEAGIKVIAVDTDTTLPGKSAFIGTDNLRAARDGALEAGNLVGRGSSAVIIRGCAGDSVHNARTKGLEQGLAEAGVEVLEIRNADSEEEKALELTENLLQKYPDLDLIITTADIMALGARTAVISEKRDVAVYGFDGTVSAALGVADGTMLGTVAQFPYEMGGHAIETAVALEKGEETEPMIDTGYRLIDRSNAKAFASELEKKTGYREDQSFVAEQNKMTYTLGK